MFSSLYKADEKNYHLFATLIFNHRILIYRYHYHYHIISIVIIITVTNVT